MSLAMDKAAASEHLSRGWEALQGEGLGGCQSSMGPQQEPCGAHASIQHIPEH